MDFQKLDPTVAAELSGENGGDPDRDLAVFVHVASSLRRDEADRLAERLEQPVSPGGVLSLTLPARRISALSEEPWVVAIRASHRLRPLT
jgi:hypothetical protein